MKHTRKQRRPAVIKYDKLVIHGATSGLEGKIVKHQKVTLTHGKNSKKLLGEMGVLAEGNETDTRITPTNRKIKIKKYKDQIRIGTCNVGITEFKRYKTESLS